MRDRDDMGCAPLLLLVFVVLFLASALVGYNLKDSDCKVEEKRLDQLEHRIEKLEEYHNERVRHRR